jgi:DNA polymerase-3 subunit alpha
MLDDALFNIKLNRGETVVLEELDLNADEKTFELLSRGDTLGVFQLDGDSMRQLLRLLKPTEFEHISAVIALYRPGPMGMNSHINYAQRKNGQQQSEGVHPELTEPLSEILDPTYGLIVYQEQVMAAAQRVAGYSLGQADLLRRAMGKKKPEELDKQLEVFRSGMKANGFSDGAIKALWDTLLPFADYAFNKAHSAGYAVLSYWTGYLKANYPAEYMAALLTSVGDSKDKLAVYLNECRRMGIRVLPPDVNQSISGFAAVGDDIRFGLNAIRNVGKNVVDAIVEARAESPFDSFQDYLTRVATQASTKRCVESLIKAGAFDSLGHTRRSLIAVHEEAIDASAVLKKQAASGQVDLFGGMFDEDPAMVPVPNLPEWTKRDLLAHEREMLGLYVSDHPLAGQEALLMRHSDMGTIALKESEIKDGESVTLAGLITQVQHKVARASGNPYGQVVLEDFSGEISIMFMGKTYLENRELLKADQTVSIRGRIQRRDEEVMLSAYSLDVLEAGREQGGVLVISVKEAMATKTKLQKLSEILAAHPGPVEVQLKMQNGGESKHFLLPQRIAVGHDLFGEIKALLGQDAVN